MITIGTIVNGKTEYKIYNEVGQRLPEMQKMYEIGSLTKTFDGGLICKAVDAGKMKLEDSIDQYLDLPKKNHYPTIRDLVTHTSGYKSFYLESEMIKNHLSGRNDMYGISKQKILNRLTKINLKNENHRFCYSNFGMAVIGLILENVYGQDYTSLMNNFVQEELNLKHTSVSTGSGNGENFWDWKQNDAYMPAGAMVSNITDMLSYVQMQMDTRPEYLKIGQQLKREINVSKYLSLKFGIHADKMGVNWIYDSFNQVYWHSGDTRNYCSFIGFNPEKKIGVVILSDQKRSDNVSVIVRGMKVYEGLK